MAERPDESSTPDPVEAELDRLAGVPDDAPSVPTLSTAPVYAPSARVASTRTYEDVLASVSNRPRRRRRRPLRRLFSTIVVLGIIAGGLYAAKFYFYDVRWSSTVKPLAEEVEDERGLDFVTAVEVVTQPSADYADTLVRAAFDIDDDNLDLVGGGWRAMGLLSGPLDTAAIGRSALPDQPAFYDPASETIYVLADLPDDLRRFALHRALTMALLDQRFDWWTRASEAAPSVRRGILALYDADALAVATALLGDDERSNVITQRTALVTAFSGGGTPSPFAAAVVARLGLALQPAVAALPTADRDLVLTDRVISDATALDVRRFVAAAPADVSSQSEGMLFWYHLMAARVDVDRAWRASLAWIDDDVSVVRGAETVCVTGRLTVDPAAVVFVDGVLQEWLAAAPAESVATVEVKPTAGEFTVSACDPGESVPTNSGVAALSLGGAPLRAAQFGLLRLADPTLDPAQVACAVFGNDAITAADERSLVDPPEGWAALFAHPAPDLARPDCAAG